MQYRGQTGRAGWRLLAAGHAPLVASFLHASFIAPNLRTLTRQELVVRLDDLLHHLRAEYGRLFLPPPTSSRRGGRRLLPEPAAGPATATAG
ncbi:DUF3375 family protein [Caenispirillum salinarum]|uniref:DUF3375 family protein n=1 Tax=Caenispirillum salinarum TaxID=859058 RepID=UPI0009FE14FA